MIKLKRSQIIPGTLLILVLGFLCFFKIRIPADQQAYAELRQEAKRLFEDYGRREGLAGKEQQKAQQAAAGTKKTAYLTFDDGPSRYTATILDILKENDACATFFLIGGQVSDDNRELLERLLEEGNEIGIHTFSHESEIYSSKKRYLEDFYQARDQIWEILQIEPGLYRFPWGSANGYLKPFKSEIVGLLEEEGYTYEDWNVSGEDSVGNPSVREILNNIKKDLTRFQEPVILLHDSSINENTVRALPEIIRLIRQEGYAFDVLKNKETPCQY